MRPWIWRRFSALSLRRGLSDMDLFQLIRDFEQAGLRRYCVRSTQKPARKAERPFQVSEDRLNGSGALMISFSMSLFAKPLAKTIQQQFVMRHAHVPPLRSGALKTRRSHGTARALPGS